ncbi:MAG: PAS domain-containing sensor histidine kinase [Chloroflexi bacterium]|nr:MAG: PAS domain-containing sensor histidine kinase [Chloroflexota bacterium]
MKSLLQFKPFVIPTNSHLHKQRQIQLIICFSLFVASLLLTILFSFVTQANIGRMSQSTIRLMPITAIFYLVLLFLIHHGWSNIVSYLIIVQLFIAFTFTAATTSGIHDPAIMGYFLLLAIVALLLGSRAMIVTGVINVFTLLCLFYGEVQGWIIINETPNDTFVKLISITIALGLTAVILRLAINTISDALKDSQMVSNSLQASEEKWSSLMKHTHSLVLTLDTKANVLFVNHPIQQLKKAINIPIYHYFQEKQHDKIKKMLEAVQQTGEAIIFEATGRANETTPPNYEVQIGPIQRDGEMIGMIVIARDITERRIVEQAVAKYAEDLARSNHDLEEFAYIASHDLQEPLRMISSYLMLLQKKYSTELDDEANEFIEIAVNGAKRLRQLIRSLLAYSRISQTEVPTSIVDCSLVLKNTLRYLQLAIEDTNATIIADDLPSILGDGEQVGTLFQNLISNALKFHSSHPPQIKIKAIRKDNNMWQFSIADNGIGMKPKNTKRIFTIFQRLHTTNEYPGTGVGLAICKKIVNRHNGRIWVKTKPGNGTTFFFTLPSENPILVHKH